MWYTSELPLICKIIFSFSKTQNRVKWSGVMEIYTPVKILSLVSWWSVQRKWRKTEFCERKLDLWQAK